MNEIHIQGGLEGKKAWLGLAWLGLGRVFFSLDVWVGAPGGGIILSFTGGTAFFFRNARFSIFFLIR
jgi:hypothetical protein